MRILFCTLNCYLYLYLFVRPVASVIYLLVHWTLKLVLCWLGRELGWNVLQSLFTSVTRSMVVLSTIYFVLYLFSQEDHLSSDFATLQDLISNGVGLFLVNASMSHLQHAWWANGTLRLQSTGLHGSSIIWLYNLTRSYAIVRCGIFVWTVFFVRLPCTASRW